MKIALLAKGDTLKKYPGREGYCEVWGLNQLARSHDLDLLFVMDDLVSRMPAWDSDLPEWLKTYQKPIITSKAYPEWPTSFDFPILEVAGWCGWPQAISFHSTVDYMIAYGIHLGAERMDLYGIDCANPKREERARVSIAMWIAVAQSKGIVVTTQPGSFFHWFTQPGVCWEQALYGYSRPPRVEDIFSKSYRAKGG
jgi:hypothetical protein